MRNATSGSCGEKEKKKASICITYGRHLAISNLYLSSSTKLINATAASDAGASASASAAYGRHLAISNLYLSSSTKLINATAASDAGASASASAGTFVVKKKKERGNHKRAQSTKSFSA
ncbi:unnamed protein product [Brugia pahangi]|uniref:Uncharacterized protein n=1 Tax=Brugia pahangi TaxID=6280 RepID=A0A0N4T654_BRUPA|nr:unnamed protein product [Brugia pahangi]